MGKAFKVLIPLFLLMLSTPKAAAQISVSGGEDKQKHSNLLVKADSIYLFSSLDNIILKSTIGDASFNYIWHKFNTTSLEWDIPLAEGNISNYPLSSAGGYQLIVEDGAKTDTFRCWIFSSQISELYIEVLKSDCDYVELSALTPELNYYGNNGAVAVANGLHEFQWLGNPAQKQAIDPVPSPLIEAPAEDTEYSVTVKYKDANPLTASLSIEGEDIIAVKAIYDYEPVKPEVANEGHKPYAEGSAPFEIRFTDKSKGDIAKWEWKFGKITSIDRDPFHIFTTVGKDTVILRVIGASGCEDSSEPFEVSITEMTVEAPNAFSPNGDGVNDEFRVYYKSVKKFRMTIISRWGRKVYESDDPSRGWDGSIGSGEAPPGVYYYFIEAEGYNRVDSEDGKSHIEKKSLSGALHLIRGK